MTDRKLNIQIYLADILSFKANPFYDSDAVAWQENYALVIQDGLVRERMPQALAKKKYPQASVHDYTGKILLPGLIDCHAHYPQLAMTAAWGVSLLPWLNQYTFPEESKFDQSDYANHVARHYQQQCLQNGITTPVVFASSHDTALNAWFTQANQINMRSIAGQVLMDRNAPDDLCVNFQIAAEQCQNQIDTYHQKGRNQVAITPRFAATSSSEQLESAGQLLQDNPSCLMQTHLSENLDELKWMQSLYPDRIDYLDIYEHFGLLNERCLFAHGIHLSEREIQRISSTQARIIHCPSSNLFLGSGLFDANCSKEKRIPFALGTDVGAGPGLNMFQTMAASYHVSKLKQHPLNSFQLFWLATQGAAEALHLDHKIGALKPGQEADFIILSPENHPGVKFRSDYTQSLEELLFVYIMLGDDRLITGTWLQGVKQTLQP